MTDQSGSNSPPGPIFDLMHSMYPSSLQLPVSDSANVKIVIRTIAKHVFLRVACLLHQATSAPQTPTTC